MELVKFTQQIGFQIITRILFGRHVSNMPLMTMVNDQGEEVEMNFFEAFTHVCDQAARQESDTLNTLFPNVT